MSVSQQSPPSLPVLRLIAAALLSGPLAFAVVIGVLLETREGGGGLGSPTPVLETLGIALAALCVPVAFVVRSTLWRRGRGADERVKLEHFAGGVLMFLALLEGAILLNLVTWLVNGNSIPPAIVAGVLWAIAAALGFPTQTQLEEI